VLSWRFFFDWIDVDVAARCKSKILHEKLVNSDYPWTPTHSNIFRIKTGTKVLDFSWCNIYMSQVCDFLTLFPLSRFVCFNLWNIIIIDLWGIQLDAEQHGPNCRWASWSFRWWKSLIQDQKAWIKMTFLDKKCTLFLLVFFEKNLNYDNY